MEDLFPNYKGLAEHLPDVLLLEDPERGHEIARSHLKAAGHLTRAHRQYLAIAYLAHCGKLVDNQGRVKFDVTDGEAASLLNEGTDQDALPGNVAEVREELMGKIDEGKPAAFADAPFVRYNRNRTCRISGEERRAYRVYPQVLDPVTSE